MSIFSEDARSFYLETLQARLRRCSAAAHPVALGPVQVSQGLTREPAEPSSIPLPDVIRISVPRRPPKPFDYQVRLPILEDAKKGSLWVLTAWIRSGQGCPGSVIHMVEGSDEPYTNLLYWPTQSNVGWTQVWLPFEIEEDFFSGRFRYQLLIQDGPQRLELGGLALFNLGSEVYRQLLPDSRHVSAHDWEDSDCSQPPDDYHLGLSSSFSNVVWRLPPVLGRGLDSAKPWGQVRSVRKPVEGQAFSECLALSAQSRAGLCYFLHGEFEAGQSLHLNLCLQADEVMPIQVDIVSEDCEKALSYRFCLAGPDWSREQFEIPLPSDLSAPRIRLRLEGRGEFCVGPLACWSGRGSSPKRTRRPACDESWKESAYERIEECRKAPLSILVQDSQGRPIPDCQIESRQLGHQFGFGTAVDERMIRESSPEAIRYREELLKLGFNTVIPERELNWRVWHRANPLERSRAIQALRWLLDKGFRVRGHFLVSGGWVHLPEELRRESDIDSVVLERLRSTLTFPELGESIFEWDLFNEPFWVTDLLSAIDPESVPGWFNEAARLSPGCRFVVNQDRILSVGGHYAEVVEPVREFMQKLSRNTSAKLGLGVECHLRGFIPSPKEVLDTLARLSGDDWDLRVTELDVSGGDDRAFEDFLLALFSFPGLSAINIWNFWDKVHWHGDALVFDNDWKLKPKGEILLSLMRETWSSHHSLRTDSDGQAQVRVFKGRHRIQASHELGECTVEVDIHDNSAPVVLTLGHNPKPPSEVVRTDRTRVADSSDIRRLTLLGCPCDDVIWQNSEELEQYLAWLKQFHIRRYLEIGSWTGRLINFLHRELAFEKVAACDLGWAEEAGLEIRFDPDIHQLRASSWSPEFLQWREALGPMDVVFIDGDHTYEGVKRDFEINRAAPHRFLVFHDIKEQRFGPGVVKFWKELKGHKFEISASPTSMGIGIWSSTENPDPKGRVTP